MPFLVAKCWQRRLPEAFSQQPLSHGLKPQTQSRSRSGQVVAAPILVRAI
jgi:hypothetical protein